MSVRKRRLEPTMKIAFLRVKGETETCRFEVPVEKLDKLAAVIASVLAIGNITFTTLEELVGKMLQHTRCGASSQPVYVAHVQHSIYYQFLFDT